MNESMVSKLKVLIDAVDVSEDRPDLRDFIECGIQDIITYVAAVAQDEANRLMGKEPVMKEGIEAYGNMTRGIHQLIMMAKTLRVEPVTERVDGETALELALELFGRREYQS